MPQSFQRRKDIMKKTLTVLLAALMLIASMAACGSKKTALSAADFTAKAKEAGLSVEDASDIYTDDIFTDALLAKGSDFSIVYLGVDSEDHAKSYWSTCKTFMEGQKTGAGSSQTTDNDNYKMYSQSNGGRFMYACQIGATMVYVDEDDTKKDAIKEVLKKLGY